MIGSGCQRLQTQEETQRILDLNLFRSMDSTSFPISNTLVKIIQTHTRLVRYKRGDIVVRAGEYGHSAFLVVSGAVDIILTPNLPDEVLGRSLPTPLSVWGSLKKLFYYPTFPEMRSQSHGLKGIGSDEVVSRHFEDEVRIALTSVETILNTHKTVRLDSQSSDLFGEIGALSRFPRNVSVLASEDSELLVIPWQALRDLRRFEANFRKRSDTLFRERSIRYHLMESKLFSHLNETQVSELEKNILFETYGDWEWHLSYKQSSSESSQERLLREPIIVREGVEFPDDDQNSDLGQRGGLILIRSGFGRISKQINHGHRTVGFLGKDRNFGLREILHQWRTGERLPYQFTLRALGYVHILRVPTLALQKFGVLEKLSSSKALVAQTSQTTNPSKVEIKDPGILEFLVEHRFINGVSTMLINLDRCLRCDDCVRACSIAHNGNPRFIRHGPIHETIMVANACMHCMDPVCMIGCPTGAIHRNPQGGEVIVNDDTCIGCTICASSCPYNAIRMVEICDNNGNTMMDTESAKPLLKAVKCDLCLGQRGGPACQRSCPNNALIRVDMGNTRLFRKWLHS